MIRQGAVIALLGLAASLVVAVLTNRSQPVVTSEPVVAVTQRIQGRPVIGRSDARRGPPQSLSVAMPVHADDVIETDGASRAALQPADGSSVRIDQSSRVRFLAPAVLELIAGAVYIETVDGSLGFELRTQLGTLRDVGTQFEVRLNGSSLRLRVRSGTVEIRRGASVRAAAAGTEATVSSDGIAVRPVFADESEWAWIAEVSPSSTIEGRPVREFLERAASLRGWTLRYADSDVAEAAGRIIMHGSVDGLNTEEALKVVLTTSGLQYSLRGGELFVSRPVNAR
jgi:ferric-dicitrate binding protein FerR (iron transport regulator)